MQRSIRPRRALLAATALGLLGGASALPAFALDAATGKVILTLTGRVAHTNDGAAAVFDLALLQQLPQHSFRTHTPWYPQPRKFGGVLLRDLLAAVGAQGSTLNAVALNDYRVEIPVDDLVDHGAMIAYLLDDNPMPVREKGPLVIIYPFDDHPDLRSAVRYSRAIWQLRSIEVK